MATFVEPLPDVPERAETEGVLGVPGVVHPVLPAGDLPDDLTETLVGIADVYEEDMLARVVAVAQVRVHEERLNHIFLNHG